MQICARNNFEQTMVSCSKQLGAHDIYIVEVATVALEKEPINHQIGLGREDKHV